jgi:hypothetical protein
MPVLKLSIPAMHPNLHKERIGGLKALVRPLKRVGRLVDTRVSSILPSTTAGSRFFLSREPAVFACGAEYLPGLD